MSIKNGWEVDIIEKKLKPLGHCGQRELPGSAMDLLKLLDIVNDELIIWASCHAPKDRYDKARKAFWEACNIVAGLK